MGTCCRARLLVLFFVLLFAGIAGAGEVLFEDQFDGDSIDEAKWRIDGSSPFEYEIEKSVFHLISADDKLLSVQGFKAPCVLEVRYKATSTNPGAIWLWAGGNVTGFWIYPKDVVTTVEGAKPGTKKIKIDSGQWHVYSIERRDDVTVFRVDKRVVASLETELTNPLQFVKLGATAGECEVDWVRVTSLDEGSDGMERKSRGSAGIKAVGDAHRVVDTGRFSFSFNPKGAEFDRGFKIFDKASGKEIGAFYLSGLRESSDLASWKTASSVTAGPLNVEKTESGKVVRDTISVGKKYTIEIGYILYDDKPFFTVSYSGKSNVKDVVYSSLEFVAQRNGQTAEKIWVDAESRKAEKYVEWFRYGAKRRNDVPTAASSKHLFFPSLVLSGPSASTSLFVVGSPYHRFHVGASAKDGLIKIVDSLYFEAGKGSEDHGKLFGLPSPYQFTVGFSQNGDDAWRDGYAAYLQMYPEFNKLSSACAGGYIIGPPDFTKETLISQAKLGAKYIVTGGILKGYPENLPLSEELGLKVLTWLPFYAYGKTHHALKDPERAGFLHTKFADSIVKDAQGQPHVYGDDTVLMNIDPAFSYGKHLLDVLKERFDTHPEYDGLFIDVAGHSWGADYAHSLAPYKHYPLHVSFYNFFKAAAEICRERDKTLMINYPTMPTPYADILIYDCRAGEISAFHLLSGRQPWVFIDNRYPTFWAEEKGGIRDTFYASLLWGTSPARWNGRIEAEWASYARANIPLVDALTQAESVPGGFAGVEPEPCVINAFRRDQLIMVPVLNPLDSPVTARINLDLSSAGLPEDAKYVVFEWDVEKGASYKEGKDRCWVYGKEIADGLNVKLDAKQLKVICLSPWDGNEPVNHGFTAIVPGEGFAVKRSILEIDQIGYDAVAAKAEVSVRKHPQRSARGQDFVLELWLLSKDVSTEITVNGLESNTEYSVTRDGKAWKDVQTDEAGGLTFAVIDNPAFIRSHTYLIAIAE